MARTIILAAVILAASLGFSLTPAGAYSCTTQCYYNTCYTNCW